MWLVIEMLQSSRSFDLLVPIEEGDFVVGRDDGCTLQLSSANVSGRHLRIRRRGDAVSFEDLGSTSGVLLNGKESASGSLVEGDLLTLGPATLRFTLLRPRPATVRRIAAVPQSGPEERSSVSAGNSTPFRSFFDRLRSASAPPELLRHLLDGVIDHLGARRGFVLLVQDGQDALLPVASRGIDDVEGFASVSSTVYQRALKGGGVVHVPNSLHDDACAEALSLAQVEAPLTIVCGPLVARGVTYGVIYVDREALRGGVDQAGLRLFETYTGLASELLAGSKTRDELLAARAHMEALSGLAWKGERLVLGESKASRELNDLLEATAPREVSVLITGETGTGKEMVARALHRLSPRSRGPFVPVNCAALARDIIEAELFGAEKGAFTGAVKRRLGRFELASGGTLFLDELGELDVGLQTKLLRVLQERVVHRLGGTCPISVDFRLVCATNVDVAKALREGRIREDLYYRVNVMRIDLKPLRERPEDILPLAKHFLSGFGHRIGHGVTGFNEAASELMRSYEWPGNVRELRNAVERAVVVEKGSLITPEALPLLGADLPTASAGTQSVEWTRSLPRNYDKAREQFERAFLLRSLKRHKGKIAAVSRDTGLTRASIYRRLEKLGIDSDA